MEEKIRAAFNQDTQEESPMRGVAGQEMIGEQVDDIANRFTHHPPRHWQAEKYVAIRDTAKAFARLIKQTCPTCRETSLALTKLEETVMWANAGVARH